MIRRRQAVRRHVRSHAVKCSIATRQRSRTQAKATVRRLIRALAGLSYDARASLLAATIKVLLRDRGIKPGDASFADAYRSESDRLHKTMRVDLNRE